MSNKYYFNFIGWKGTYIDRLPRDLQDRIGVPQPDLPPPGDRRVYLAWVLSRAKSSKTIIQLPVDVVRLIVSEVYRAGANARRALVRHIRVARIIDYWMWQWWPFGGIHVTNPIRLMNQMTQHWLNLGQEFWTPRERRSVERRRITQPHRNEPYMLRSLGNPVWWEQWGLGSR